MLLNGTMGAAYGNIGNYGLCYKKLLLLLRYFSLWSMKEKSLKMETSVGAFWKIFIILMPLSSQVT